MKRWVISGFGIVALSCLVILSISASADQNWPTWRGPLFSGAAPDANPPVEWDEDRNIRWKVSLPGLGHGTPIIWENRIYVSSATAPDASGKVKFIVTALNGSDGSVAWEKVAREQSPHDGLHQTNTYASNSAVTDGNRLYAYFGSMGLYCYDMDGNLQWEKDLGDMRTRNSFGEGSSPALHGDRLVLNWDHEGQSFIVALNAATGDEQWRKDRDESSSWATPLIVEHGGKTHVITSATNLIRSYDLSNGDILWQCGGMTANTIPSPIYDGEYLYAMSGFRGNALVVIRMDAAKGDITGTDAVVWNYDRDTPYVPSPLLYDNVLYFLKSNNNLLSAFNAKTGEALYSAERVEGLRNVYASPIGAGGRIYIADREGSIVVLQSGPGAKVLATNKLDDGFSASPVAVADALYLRGERNLYCIAAK